MDRGIAVAALVLWSGCAPALGTPRTSDDDGSVRCYDGDVATDARALCADVIVVEAGDVRGCSLPVADDLACSAGPFCGRWPGLCAPSPWCAEVPATVRSLSDCDAWIAQCEAAGSALCLVSLDGTAVTPM